MNLDRISFTIFISGLCIAMVSLLAMLTLVVLAVSGDLPPSYRPTFPLYGILVGLWTAVVGGGMKIGEWLLDD